MLRLETYLFRTAAVAFLVTLATLSGVLWITGALKEISLLTSKGQTILIFLSLTGLAAPFLIASIAPIALFGSIVYCLNRLNGDSELIVMSASGAPPATLLRPFLLLSGLVTAALVVLHGLVIPLSFNAVDELTRHVHADFIANFARPGAFNQLEAGFIFHYREKGPNGSLKGVFIQDRRNPREISTFIAETGELVERGDDSYLVLRQGSAQRPSERGRFVAGDVSGLRHRPQPVRSPGGGRGEAPTTQSRPRGAAEIRRERPHRENLRRRGARGTLRPPDEPALCAGGGADRLRRAGTGAHDPADPQPSPSSPPSRRSPACASSASPTR